ncbi:MAG: hypothetical protein DRO93_13370, partial [Candidatus Thorarchaeota archaeon]
MNAMNLSVLNDLMFISVKTPDDQIKGADVSVPVGFQDLLDRILELRGIDRINVEASDVIPINGLWTADGGESIHIPPHQTRVCERRNDISHGLQGGSRLIGGRPDEGASAPSISLRRIQIMTKPFGNIRRLASKLRDIVITPRLTFRDLYDLVEKIKDRVESEGAELREIILTGFNIPPSSSSTSFTSIAPSGVKIDSSGLSAHHLARPRRGRPDGIIYARRPPNLTSQGHMETTVHISTSSQPQRPASLPRYQAEKRSYSVTTKSLENHILKDTIISESRPSEPLNGGKTFGESIPDSILYIRKAYNPSSGKYEFNATSENSLGPTTLGSSAHHPAYGSVGVGENKEKSHTPMLLHTREVISKDIDLYAGSDTKKGVRNQPLKVGSPKGVNVDVKTEFQMIPDDVDPPAELRSSPPAASPGGGGEVEVALRDGEGYKVADLKKEVHIPGEVIPDDVDPPAELRFSSLIGDQEVQHRDGIVGERGIKPQLDLGQQIESTYQSRQREETWKAPVMSSRSPADKISSSDITTRIISQGEMQGIIEDDVLIGEEGDVYQGKVTYPSREELPLSFQNQPVQEISNQRRIGQNVKAASSTSIPVDDPPRVFPWKPDIRSRAFSIVEAAMRSPSSSFSGEADYTSRSPSGATNNADSIGLYSPSGLGDDISRDDLRRKPTGIQVGNQYEISREVSSEHQPIVPQGEAVSIPTGNTSPVRHLVRFVQLDGKGLNINAINPDLSHEPDHPSPRVALYGDNSTVLITISSSSAEDSSIHPRSDEVGGVQAPPYFILSREGMESDPDPAYHTGLAGRATQDGGGSSSTAGGNPDVIPGAPEKRLEAGRWEDQAVRGVKRKAEIIFKNAVIHPGSDLKEGVYTPAVSVEGRIDGMR